MAYNPFNMEIEEEPKNTISDETKKKILELRALMNMKYQILSTFKNF